MGQTIRFPVSAVSLDATRLSTFHDFRVVCDSDIVAHLLTVFLPKRKRAAEP